MDKALNPGFGPELVFHAYCQGIFPMAEPDGEIRWYAPHKRALFPIDGIHVSRSLLKLLKRDTFEVTFNKCFSVVMRHCLRPGGNWISEEIIEVYTEIHHQGWAHSCEVWRDHELVGGIYGLEIGSCFCAESMFHRQTNASKVALWALVNRCRECGYTLFDAQMMNPHLASLGAYEVDQQQFIEFLNIARSVMPQPISSGGLSREI